MADQKALQSFFQSYARVLSAGDLPGVAACYEVPALVLGDQVAIAVPDLKAVEAAFAGAADRYRAQGMVEVAPEITRIDEITPRMAMVEITWSYLDANKAVRQQTRYRYLVRDSDGGVPKIRVVLAVAE